MSAEISFLKIRYKLPDSNTSTLITKKIDDSLEIAEFDSTDTEMRFAAAVDGFGQLLRQDTYTQNFSYKGIIAMALAAKGEMNSAIDLNLSTLYVLPIQPKVRCETESNRHLLLRPCSVKRSAHTFMTKLFQSPIIL